MTFETISNYLTKLEVYLENTCDGAEFTRMALRQAIEVVNALPQEEYADEWVEKVRSL